MAVTKVKHNLSGKHAGVRNTKVQKPCSNRKIIRCATSTPTRPGYGLFLLLKGSELIKKQLTRLKRNCYNGLRSKPLLSFMRTVDPRCVEAKFCHPRLRMSLGGVGESCSTSCNGQTLRKNKIPNPDIIRNSS